MVEGAQRKELGHITLMVHLAEDMLICAAARGAKGQRGLRQLSDGKDTHIFFVSSGLSTRRGLQRVRGVVCYRGLSTYVGGRR